MAEDVVFSVAVPVYNEIGSLPELHRRVAEVMDGIGEPWELVLVDDGSTDGSSDWIISKAKEDPHVKPVVFARNFGHQVAVTAGLDYSQGQAVVIMDADLQDPPEVIGDLVEKWREGFEVVYAIRAEREGETWFKKVTAALFYRMINRITDVDIPVDTGDFRLMDRKVVEVLSSMRERHRFPRAMVAWVGFRQVGVPYKRASRYAG
ncbi:MAG: glycosyltransferase family 2 protein, partial [Anaerolineales bacterium]